ncbi:AI-2E family transporter [Actinokineospora xionganensis]|uniref:AI-2E family transporter n=1 Tax=Actinokineospora xionganensis TaxID=2684470 RepID=A0ABR7L3U5_9PSEU|nr:AI-2E family transporter [Actinokineospora xionganensis]MBC6447339.1 AI-2E family transporter [Actinokineospora xionganensis]
MAPSDEVTVRKLVWAGAAVLVWAAVAYLVWRAMGVLAPVLVPVAVAVLIAAALRPAVRGLVRRRWPRVLAAALMVVGPLTVLGVLLVITVDALVRGGGELAEALRDGVGTVRDWLVRGPLGLSEPQVGGAVDNLVAFVGDQGERIVGGATATAAAVGGFLAGLVLAVFVLFFLLYEGERIWTWLLAPLSASVRTRFDQAGREAFSSLGAYSRATVAVAVVDAVVIGVGLAIIGVPMVIPLASLVFLAAFVPYVGAFVAGFVAVLVGLVSGGPVTALLVLGLSVLVQTLEGEVLQPFLLGRMVRLHPLLVVVSIAVGVVLAGIVGALFAVPVVLVARAVLRQLPGTSNTQTG